MTVMDLINDLRAQLEQVKEQGHTAATIASLEGYLSAHEAAAGQAMPDAKPDLEVWKVKAPLDHAWTLSLRDSVSKSADAALNSATLINGGAAVALLAFLGNLATKAGSLPLALSAAELRRALLAFTVGVACAGFGHVGRHFTQFFGFKENSSWAGAFHLLVMLLTVGSFGAFTWGGVQAFRAFR